MAVIYANAEVEAATTEQQRQPLLLGLAGYLKTCWDAAWQAKIPIEETMLKSLRQRNGRYSPEELIAIQQHGGSDIFVGVTDVKCRAAESWLRDILLETGTPPWAILPTPRPALNTRDMEIIREMAGRKTIALVQSSNGPVSAAEQYQFLIEAQHQYEQMVQKDAVERARGMQRLIEDQFAQGGWATAFDDLISDVVTFPAAFLKGPVVRRQRRLGWVEEDGRFVAQPIEELAPEYERVDPFNIYPEPGVTTLNDGYIFEHHPLTRSDLADLLGVTGYDNNAIRMALQYGQTTSWIIDRFKHAKAHEERKAMIDQRPTEIYDALEFWGKISGAMLLDWGIDPALIEDPAMEYDANVWLVGNYVIKATLNYDPLGEKPYSKVSFIKMPGAFWGRGVPEVIADIQRVCNATARALVNNIGLASGPQVVINVSRLAPEQEVTTLAAWKEWFITADAYADPHPAIQFVNIDSHAAELMAIYEKFTRLADEQSGIPAYIYGDLDVQGAGRTSSGLSMLMGAAGKGIRQVVGYIDQYVIKPVVNRQFVYNMRYIDDESIKGDVQIQPRGAINLVMRAQNDVRRLEFLANTNNETDMQIIGVPGRAAILREVARGLNMPVDDIVKSDAELEFMAQQATQQAGFQGGAPGMTSMQPTFPGGDVKGGAAGTLTAPR